MQVSQLCHTVGTIFKTPLLLIKLQWTEVSAEHFISEDIKLSLRDIMTLV
jgi:hypothetical protein